MMSGNDPFEFFFNSISDVKEAFLPLEVGIRNAAKDLEQCWVGTRNKGNGVQLIAQVNECGKFQICGMKNKKGGNEKRKALSTRVNGKALLDMFSQDLGNVNMGEVLGTALKEKKVVAKEDGSLPNCLQFAVTSPSLVNGFLQLLPALLKSGRKRFYNMDVEDQSCSCIKLNVLREVKQNGSKGQFLRTIGEKGVRETEGKPVSLECLIGFIDQLPQTLRSLDKGVQENDSDFGRIFLQTPSSSWFSFMKAFTDVSDWPKVDVNGFLRDLRFAKVGGVPSGVFGPTPSIKEDGDGSATVKSKEDTGDSFPQRLAADKHSVPLPNEEHTKSKLSIVSLTELVGLRLASKHHHDRKKLISEQHFLAYTEETEGTRFFEELDRDENGPRSILSKAASVVAVPPPVEIPAGSILRSALAGGLSCAFSCALMHPVDTIKTQVQASTLSFTEIISMVPRIGAKGLYRGLIPAILGQLGGHGLRTGIFEASKSILLNVAPTLLEMQVSSILSFCSTILGTAMRIPSEVVKQRLQAGLYDNMGEALVGTWHQDGLQGFFRGTGATLCREVPFYVAGMGLYDESKKAVKKLLGRELEPWEAVVVGAISGGLAGVTTTPFDVIKTRMMTTQGQSVSMAVVALSILRQEGPLGLFKGAVPRFFWIAPLGAINLAGYELARKALNHVAGEQLSQKR